MSHVSFEIKNESIGMITLNRPEAANALSRDLLRDLNHIINDIEQNDQLRVVILTANGDKAFCAGADLKERKGMSPEEVLDAVTLIHETANRIADIQIPTIASLNGVAFGGGLEFALACDIRIASSDISLGLTETSLAIIPGAGGTQRLSRLVGVGKAKELIFSAKRIPADQAQVIGLIEQVTSRETLKDTTAQLAQQIAENGPIAVKLAKQAIDEGIEIPLKDALLLEMELYRKTIHTDDRIEGLKAFNEKRKPNYIGK